MPAPTKLHHVVGHDPSMYEYLFVLGAPNDKFGALSPIARSRVEAAVGRYRQNPRLKIIATGGFGPHFNTTARPHRDYVNIALSQLGVPIAALEPEGFLSSNTVQDIIQIADFTERRGLASIGIMTSTFHVPRCQIIAGCLLPAVGVKVEGAKDPIDLDPELIKHEAAATASLQSQGGVIIRDRLYPFISCR